MKLVESLALLITFSYVGLAQADQIELVTMPITRVKGNQTDWRARECELTRSEQGTPSVRLSFRVSDPEGNGIFTMYDLVVPVSELPLRKGWSMHAIDKKLMLREEATYDGEILRIKNHESSDEGDEYADRALEIDIDPDLTSPRYMRVRFELKTVDGLTKSDATCENAIM